MGELAKVLYEKFFLRDVLGKVTPGFIAILAVVHASGLAPMEMLAMRFGSPAGPWLLVLYVVVLPLCYLAGLGLQVAGEYLGLHSASPRPWRFLWHQSAAWREALADLGERVAMITARIEDDGRRARVREQRERYVYLKEGAGNLSLALGLVAISLLIAAPGNEALAANRAWVIAALLVGAAVLWVAHRVHQARQARFEIDALKALGLRDEERAKAMSDRIPSWTRG